MTWKALTLWQPWATGILLGLKTYETRSWHTGYRGPLVIHAAARPVNRYECNETIIEALRTAGYTTPAAFPLGFGLCVVELVGCHHADLIAPKISDLERAFGDYSPGRFAWKLENVRPFPEPIKARGYQQLWDWKQ